MTADAPQDILVIQAPGPRLDGATAPSFKSGLLAAMEQGHTRIALDLTAVDFMDSIGLASIMSCLKSLGDRGAMVLFGAGPKLRKLFAITKLDQGVFRILDDETAARDALVG